AGRAARAALRVPRLPDGGRSAARLGPHLPPRSSRGGAAFLDRPARRGHADRARGSGGRARGRGGPGRAAVLSRASWRALAADRRALPVSRHLAARRGARHPGPGAQRAHTGVARAGARDARIPMAAGVEESLARYRAGLERALERTGRPDLPPSWQLTGRDWGNLAAGYPCRILPPRHPRLVALADRVWASAGGAGLVWYGTPDSLH